MKTHDERVDPSQNSSGVFKEHLATYNFAVKFINKNEVLELGSGNGYGTHLLSDYAGKITGVDISEEAVSYSNEKYKARNLVYTVMDITKLVFSDESFDIVVSFEVIEHIREYEKVICEAKRVLRIGGSFLLATPNGKYSTGKNPYHVKDFLMDELRLLLGKYFGIVEFYGQSKNNRVKEVLKEGNAFKKIMRKVDFLNLRNLILRGAIRKNIYHLFGFSVEEDLLVEDFVISTERPEDADILIARCVKI